MYEECGGYNLQPSKENHTQTEQNGNLSPKIALNYASTKCHLDLYMAITRIQLREGTLAAPAAGGASSHKLKKKQPH